MSRQRQARRDAVLTLLARRPLTASELATRLLVPVTEMRAPLSSAFGQGLAW